MHHNLLYLIPIHSPMVGRKNEGVTDLLLANKLIGIIGEA